MAVKTLHLPNFPSFDTDEILTLAPRWNTYKKRFEKNVRNVKKQDILPVAAKLNLKPLFHPETEPIIFSP